MACKAGSIAKQSSWKRVSWEAGSDRRLKLNNAIIHIGLSNFKVGSLGCKGC